MVPDDEEKINHFFSWIRSEIRRRRKILSESGGDYYNYVGNGCTMPWIVVMIHNLGSFSEAYPDLEEMLISLTRGSVKYGISFVVTATAANMVQLLMNGLDVKGCISYFFAKVVIFFDITM